MLVWEDIEGNMSLKFKTRNENSIFKRRLKLKTLLNRSARIYFQACNIFCVYLFTVCTCTEGVVCAWNIKYQYSMVNLCPTYRGSTLSFSASFVHQVSLIRRQVRHRNKPKCSVNLVCLFSFSCRIKPTMHLWLHTSVRLLVFHFAWDQVSMK